MRMASFMAERGYVLDLYERIPQHPESSIPPPAQPLTRGHRMNQCVRVRCSHASCMSPRSRYGTSSRNRFDGTGTRRETGCHLFHSRR